MCLDCENTGYMASLEMLSGGISLWTKQQQEMHGGLSSSLTGPVTMPGTAGVRHLPKPLTHSPLQLDRGEKIKQSGHELSFSVVLLLHTVGKDSGGSDNKKPHPEEILCTFTYFSFFVSEMVMLLEWWSGTDCTLYTDPESYHKYGKENAIVILNHNFEIDFLCGWNFCERFGVLGSSKVLAKKELSYMPIIGWMWYFLEIVFCKRKWEEDRKTVVQKLLNLRDYPENFWFLIHCEGTRFTEQKHQISMKVAEAKGLPKLKYHLLPRTKGFAVTVQCLRNVVLFMKVKVFNILSFLLFTIGRRIPLEDIPEDEQECSIWLHKLYQEKVGFFCQDSICCYILQDAFQEEYYRTGTYPAVPTIPPRRPWTLLNWLFWALLLLYPLFQLLINMINSGSSLTLASFAFVIIIGKFSDSKQLLRVSFMMLHQYRSSGRASNSFNCVCFAASVGVRWMIAVTEINKGSTYGNNDNKQKQK
ncbi:1-acyl-sn-glycerol-3-phosphate acyltransferase delta [Lonchura striata]|uniref:1-acyl-sn-glycerol-3-phosphate acyltransferase delta n=1 Tax=Lonchura striata TaxID=40157 RepID=A0A218V6E1_9PASE|nr:1-acyl-sn-glycerol-3-phosphate acyltransferase delta [Lonchura striata domestica]